jgi:hypothetical protein
MRRIWLAGLAAVMLAAPASAQVGSGVPKCDGDYKQFISRMSTGAAKDLTGAQLAQLNRLALRGYDGCTAGDERFSSENFFKRLETVNPAKADDFFKDLERNYPAKK